MQKFRDQNKIREFLNDILTKKETEDVGGKPLSNYRRVLPRLQSFLPNPFRLEGNTRKEETTAHVAVREAFINLCVLNTIFHNPVRLPM